MRLRAARDSNYSMTSSARDSNDVAIETYGTRGLLIDDELKPVHLLHRKLSRARALEDAINVRASTTPGHP